MIEWHWKKFDELDIYELFEIMKIRQKVFVVEQECAYLDADKYDYKSFHLFGCLKGQTDIIAYSRVIPNGIKYEECSIGRVVIDPKHRSKGYGKLLMHETLNRIEIEFGNIQIRMSAQEYLEKFYNGFDFIKVNEPYDEDGIPHIEMIHNLS